MLEQTEAVKRMQDYVTAHLTEPITMAQLARAAGYSPAWAAKSFRALTGDAPFTYVRKMRLSAAALRLRDDEGSVLDTALDFLFDSHEGFTRAFHRAFGLPPARYRREKPPVYLFTPYDVRARLALSNPNKEEKPMSDTIFVQVTDFPARKLLLKRGVHAEDYFPYCEEVGCDIWGLLQSVKEALHEPMGLWLPDSMIAPGTSRYVQGVEVPADYAGEVPEGLELIDLPACQMMVFQGEPYDEETFCEAIGKIQDAIERYDPKRFGYEWATDELPRFQYEPQGWRGYIEARPVRAAKKG